MNETERQTIISHLEDISEMPGGNQAISLLLATVVKIKASLGNQQYKRMCPICGKGSDHFLQYGVKPRPDALCPRCYSLERHRLFWMYLSKKTSLINVPPKKALHIAPESVLELKLRPLIGEGYLTADLYAQNVDLKMDITEIDFPDNSFDFIYCSHVLEHVTEDIRAMREFNRVLRHGGIAFIMVPIHARKTVEDSSVVDPKERLRLYGQEDHVRIYGQDFHSRLILAGFSVEVVSREDFLTPEEIENMGITEAAGRLHICKKQA